MSLRDLAIEFRHLHSAFIAPCSRLAYQYLYNRLKRNMYSGQESPSNKI